MLLLVQYFPISWTILTDLSENSDWSQNCLSNHIRGCSIIMAHNYGKKQVLQKI